MPLPRSIQTAALAALLSLPSVAGYTQTCNPSIVPATTPGSQFIDHGDGTVTDNKTGLMWKRCSEGQSWDGNTCAGTAAGFWWQAGLQQAQTLNDAGGFAGHADWRVPNSKELASLVEEQCFDPSINTEIFPETPSSCYRSASPGIPLVAGVVCFDDGRVGWGGRPTDGAVRLVRVGQ